MGSIGLDDSMKLIVSKGINGGQMVEQLFWNFADQPILLPQQKEYYPLEEFVIWHRSQVFKQQSAQIKKGSHPLLCYSDCCRLLTRFQFLEIVFVQDIGVANIALPFPFLDNGFIRIQ